MTSKDFSQQQRDQIVLASKRIQNFTKEMFEIMANPQLHYMDIGMIGGWFEEGLTIEQVRFLIARMKRYDYEALKRIKNGFKQGLNFEKMKFLDYGNYRFDQIEQIILAYEEGLSSEQMELFFHDQLSSTAMEFIRQHIDSVTLDNVNTIIELNMKEWYYNDQIPIMKEVMLNVLTKEQLFIITEGYKFYQYQIVQIIRGFKRGIPLELIEYAKQNNAAKEIELVIGAYQLGISKSLIMEYIKSQDFGGLRLLKNKREEENRIEETNRMFDELLRKMKS